MKYIISHTLVGVIGTVLAFFLFTQLYPPQPAPAASDTPAQLVNLPSELPVNASPRAWAAELPVDFTAVSNLVTGAVVNIVTYSATEYRLSSGSGVIVSTDGYIITNQHVIEDGANFEITFPDKRKVEARLVGIDRMTDLALLKANISGLRPIRFGDSDNVQVGEWVLAVGNPFNLNSTVTAGIVSAKARNINILSGPYSIESFIQTDAVVNPGNSGGALVNTHGELIGINTAIISESGGYEGYSFAIPANLVRKVVNDIREFGTVKRAILGVAITEVNEDIAAKVDLPSVSGVFITDVNRNSSASSAGLRTGDVIMTINNIPTNSVPELQEQVARFRPGDRISLEFYRNGRLQQRNNIILKGIDETISSY